VLDTFDKFRFFGVAGRFIPCVWRAYGAVARYHILMYISHIDERDTLVIIFVNRENDGKRIVIPLVWWG
jgi:hypothetical protein